jgi:hypothetical protein
VDIHPPHAIHSWKDFGVQLITITAGILIALSLEGVRESIHDRALVREARENIQREIADNKREVDGELAGMADRTRKIDAAKRVADDLVKTRQSEAQQAELGLEFPTLSAASWQTAERTGALAHMDYAEVQKYAGLYAFQELMSAQQRRALDALSSAIGFFAALGDGDTSKATPADVARLRDQLIALNSILYVEEQLARTASERYKKALE